MICTQAVLSEIVAPPDRGEGWLVGMGWDGMSADPYIRAVGMGMSAYPYIRAAAKYKHR